MSEQIFEEDEGPGRDDEGDEQRTAIGEANAYARAIHTYYEQLAEEKNAQYRGTLLSGIAAFTHYLNDEIRHATTKRDYAARVHFAAALLEHYDLLGEISDKGQISGLRIDPDAAGMADGEILPPVTAPETKKAATSAALTSK